MPTAKIDDTLEMYYEDDDFADPWSERETIVLHHGMAKNGRLWYAWVPLLARKYRVVRLDARGFGRSTVPPSGYPWSLSGFAADLRGLLDNLGLDRVHLIGETVGGSIALKFAYEYPERLRSLAVCTSPFRFVGVTSHAENMDLVRREGIGAWVRKTTAHRLSPPQASPQHIEWYAQQMASTTPYVVVESVTALSDVDLENDIRQIQVPTLAIFGEEAAGSATFQPHEMPGIMPNCKLVVLPGATGFVQHSAPGRCVEAWLEFVGELPKSA